MRDVTIEGTGGVQGGEGTWELSVLSVQLFYNPKTALKNKVFFQKEKKKKDGNAQGGMTKHTEFENPKSAREAGWQHEQGSGPHLHLSHSQLPSLQKGDSETKLIQSFP